MTAAETSIFELAGRLVKMQVQMSSLENDFTSIFTGHKMVSYNQLEDLPKMQWLTVGSGGQTIKLPHESLGLLFLTDLNGDGGHVGPHKNDCMEVVHILSGQVYEAVSKTTLEAGQTHRIKPGVSHYFIAQNGDARLLVEIFQPKILKLFPVWVKNLFMLFFGHRD